MINIALFFIVVAYCLARSEQKQSNKFVWTTFVNNSGWPDGICFATGLVTPGFMFGGLDAALHLAEECSNPSKTVPRAVLASVFIGFATGFPFAIVMLYTLSDFDAILNNPFGYLPLLLLKKCIHS